MKTFIFALFLLSLAACQPKSQNPQAEQAAGGGVTPTAQGTSSAGGGGNGIDGKALELYAVDITAFPEYRRYIEPVIAKIGFGQGDVLALYMKWAVKHKTWYMVNKDLQALSKERVGVTFDTEQLARHSEREIYIHAPSYYSSKNKTSDRAELLMHELVMGARLLMKKPAKEQCEALQSANPGVCSKKETLASAQNPGFTAEQAAMMDSSDVEAVRSMTVYLMSHTQDVTGLSVREMRRQLQFVFPWDRLVSNLSPSDFALAVRRTAATQGPFKSLLPPLYPPPSPLVQTACYYSMMFDDNISSSAGGFGMSFQARNASTQAVSSYDLSKPTAGYSSTEVEFADEKVQRIVSDGAFVWSSSDSYRVRGVPDPANPNEIIDQVTLDQSIPVEDAMRWKTQNNIGFRFKILVSRDEKPRLLRITAYQIKVLFANPNAPVKSLKDFEVIADTKKPVLDCVPN